MEMVLLFWFSATILLLYALLTRRNVGNLLDLGDKPHRSLASLAKSHGPLMSLKLGNVTAIVISSPEVAREVLQKNDQSFSGRCVLDAAKALHHNEASIAWLHAGPQWRNLRRICNTELFMSQKLDDNEALRQNKVRDLVAYVKEHCLTGEAVDIGRAAFTVVMNSLSTTFFSVDMAHIKSESAHDFKKLVWGILEEAGKHNVSDFFPWLAAVDLQRRRHRMASLFKKLDDIFGDIIDARMLVKGEGSAGTAPATNDLLDSLIESRLDRHAMICLLKDLFVAGSNTSSSTIEWAMAELLQNQSTMEKAIAELRQTISDGREIEESDIQQLPYLQAVVKETLRLHPPIPLLVPHRAETDVQLCGYTIPEGTKVLVNVWAMGRDEKVWTNSDLFMPERFLGKDIDFKGQDFELIPFGAGRRMCPGLPLAFLMVHLVLASLLLEFSWKLPEGMKSGSVDMTERFGLTLTKASPLQAVPALR